MKKILLALAVAITATGLQAKTLIAYYSFTNNVHTIATDLQEQTGADIVRIEPAEKGLDYAADNYAIGSSQIAAIRANPNEASSYPAIDAVNINLADYEMIIIAAPLWWSNMAAPMQTFLFQYGAQMEGKHIGLIVSSASSGISNVVEDAKRLVPNGNFVEPNLWIRSSQTPNCHELNAQWLKDIDYESLISGIASLSTDNAERYTLYNMSGRQVAHTNALLPSVYIKNTGNISKKLVVKR